MSLTAIVSLPSADGYATTGTLAAFVGSTVRGVAPPGQSLPFGPYIGTVSYQMLIYANAPGETVTFKFWDGSVEYDCPETLAFVSDGTQGSVPAPMIITTTTSVTLTVPLSSGWTWMSINVVLASSALNDALSSISSSMTQEDTIKSISQFATYYSGYGWVRPAGDRMP